jgi:Lon-like ATP-dependent protease
LQTIKEGIEGHPVEWYSDVFDLVFPTLDKTQANECKICEWKKNNDKKGEREQSVTEDSD